MTTSWRRQKPFLHPTRLHPNLSAHSYQSFRLGFLRNRLQLMQDPDISSQPSQGSTRVCSTNTVLLYLAPPTDRSTRRLAFENPRCELDVIREDPDTLSRLTQEDVDAKFVQDFHGDIAQANNVDQKMWLWVALASPDQTSETHASAWTARYQSGDAFVRRRRSDHTRQQSAQETSHPRRRMGVLLWQTAPLQCATIRRD